MPMFANYRRVLPIQLTDLLREPEEIASFLDEPPDDEDGHQLSIEESWHGIHYLLTGEVHGGDPPLALAVLGGIPIGEEDFGWGPPRCLTPDHVQELAEALESVTEKDLRRRFDPDRMDKIGVYPGNWNAKGALEDLLGDYRTLRRFVEEAAGRGEGLVLFIT